VYGNRTFQKSGDDEKDKEERLLKRLVTVANSQNKTKMKREFLVATVDRKEDGGGTARIRVRVRVGRTEEGVEPAKKRGVLVKRRLCPYWAPTRHSSGGKPLPITIQLNMVQGVTSRVCQKAKRSYLGIWCVHLKEMQRGGHRWGRGVAAATKEGGKKRGQRVAAVSSPVVVVAKGRKGQGVAVTTTKQGGERKRGQSRAAALSSPVPEEGVR
jgi:hypothetical protein